MTTTPTPGPLSSVPATSGAIPGLDLLNSASEMDPSDGDGGSEEVSNVPASDSGDGDRPEQVVAPWELCRVYIFLWGRSCFKWLVFHLRMVVCYMSLNYSHTL